MFNANANVNAKAEAEAKTPSYAICYARAPKCAEERKVAKMVGNLGGFYALVAITSASRTVMAVV
jgi:hypothetical protein